MYGWLMLALAILFEVTGSIMMKLSNGFTIFWASAGVFIFYALAVSALAFSLKYIDLSVSYAIWAGVGTALVAIFGIWYFREPVSLLKIISFACVIAGVIGLQISSGQQPR